MSNSNFVGFNASDDAAFTELADDRRLLPLDGPLSLVRPSSLNLTKDCWVALDLRYLAINGSKLEETERIQHAAVDLQILLPSPNSSATLLDYGQYWNALQLLNSTLPTLERLRDYCVNIAPKQLNISLLGIQYDADCDLTGDFYARHIFPQYPLLPHPSDAISLYRASLPTPYNNLTNTTILTMAVQTINLDNWENHAGILFPPFDAQMREASIKCADLACQGLDYSGNADIAGAGVSDNRVWTSKRPTHHELGIDRVWFYSRRVHHHRFGVHLLQQIR